MVLIIELRRGRGSPLCEPTESGSQSVNGRYRREGVVHSRGERPHRDLDELDHRELEVLPGGPLAANDERRPSPVLHVPGQAAARPDTHQWRTGDDVLADPPFQA